MLRVSQNGIWGGDQSPPSLSHAMVSDGSLPGCVFSSCVRFVWPPIDTIGRGERIGEEDITEYCLNKLQHDQ